MATTSPGLAALLIGDPPAAWADLGFVVEDGAVHVSGVRHVLGGEAKGIRAWQLRGTDSAIDGIPPLLSPDPGAPAPGSGDRTPEHPNGVVALDHVVLATPNVGRTIEALEAADIELRRVRDAGNDRQQAFFKLGEVILELVGPKQPSGDGAPRFYGLAWTVRDPEATSAFFGERLKPFKPAVQPGRLIATLSSSAGSTVPHAFMSGEPG